MTDATDERILAGLRDGMTGNRIAADMGLSFGAVYARIRKLRAAGIWNPQLPPEGQLLLDGLLCTLRRCTGHTGAESWHGTASGYNHHRCRCERCAAWKSSLVQDPAYRRAWAIANRARVNERNAAWKAANLEKYRRSVQEGGHRRRARKRGNGIERYDRDAIFDRDGWVCQVCNMPVDRLLPQTHPLGPTIDHVIPICQGGPDRAENVQLAHRRCNQRREHGPRSTRKQAK